MKLVGAELKRVSSPLPAAVHNARAAWSLREGALLLVRDGEGRIGRGEASPLPGFSPDSLDDCISALRAISWTALPSFAAPSEVADLVNRVDARLPAARFALETALLDLMGQDTGRSLPSLLGAREGRQVPLSVLLQSETAASQAEEVQRALRGGVRCFKRKLRWPHVGHDAQLLRALRHEVGAAALRLDANQAFALDEAPALLEELSEVSPEWVEEPVVAGGLTHVKDSPVPLAADETLQDPRCWDAVLEFFQARGTGTVVLKPMALGGSLHCLELARRAHGAGVGAVVSHLLDGPVALAACAALALALPGAPVACGLAPHPGLRAWPELALPFIRSGQLVSWTSPGLP